jgi:hypothetical protein
MKVVKCRIPPHEPDQPIVGPKEALEDIAAVREFLQREARSTNEKEPKRKHCQNKRLVAKPAPTKEASPHRGDKRGA